MQRSPSTYGRVSHTLSVLSIEFDSSIVPSGESFIPVMVSVWPFHVSLACARFRLSDWEKMRTYVGCV